MALTRRAVKVYAVLEECRQGSKDIIDALLPFFQPLLAERTGEVLNVNTFANAVANTYGWNFSPEIVEELVPRFLSRGWVSRIAGSQKGEAYRINEIESGTDTERNYEIANRLQEISIAFHEFVKEISPLTVYEKSPTELSDILVEWLVSIDAYDENVLKKEALIKVSDGIIGIYQELPDGNSLSNDDKYLCARFVKKLFDEKSSLTVELCGIAAAGLVTEVVRDFHKPVSAVSKSDLRLYLDSTIALELLGVSGSEAQLSVNSVKTAAENIGCKLFVFDNTLEEMQRSLNALLNRDIPSRDGPTATALRRGETTEGFVREVARIPEHYLEQLGIQIVRRRLNQFPNEFDFFPNSEVSAFYSRINWHQEDAPRNHDATIVALIMRMRKGDSSRDFFNSKHVFVTRNGMLTQMAQKFCVEEDLINRNRTPPVLHLRQIATALWLRTGEGINAIEIPRHLMLAACDKVLSLRRTMVDKVRFESRSLNPSKVQQLELMMTQDRSVQMLMDKTLGASRVINSTNIDMLVEAMRSELVADAEKKTKEEIKALRKEKDAELLTERKRRASLEAQHGELSLSMNALMEADQKIVDALLREVNVEARMQRYIIRAGVCFLILAFAVASVGISLVSGAIWYAVAFVIVIGFAFLAALQIFDLSVRLDDFFERLARSKLNSQIAKRALKSKFSDEKIVWVKNRLIFSLEQETGEEIVPGAVSAETPLI